MANICITGIKVYGPEEEIAVVWENLESATKENTWLGRLLMQIGWSDEEIKCGSVRCRGEIICMERTSADEIQIDTDTAWVPMLQVFVLFLEKFGPTCEMTYTSEEPGCEIFFTNDLDTDAYCVDVWEPDELPESLREIDHYVSGKHLKEVLTEALGAGEELDALFEKAAEKWGDFLSIHQFEYVPISELS